MDEYLPADFVCSKRRTVYSNARGKLWVWGSRSCLGETIFDYFPVKWQLLCLLTHTYWLPGYLQSESTVNKSNFKTSALSHSSTLSPYAVKCQNNSVQFKNNDWQVQKRLLFSALILLKHLNFGTNQFIISRISHVYRGHQSTKLVYEETCTQCVPIALFYFYRIPAKQ